MKVLRPLVGAFVVGGLLGLLGQVFMALFGAMGVPPQFVAPLVLVSMGLVGCGLFIANIYQKIEKIGGFGAMLPFSGFDAAIAGVSSAARTQSGTAAAVKAGVGLFFSVAGVGIVVSIVVGVVAALIQ